MDLANGPVSGRSGLRGPRLGRTASARSCSRRRGRATPRSRCPPTLAGPGHVSAACGPLNGQTRHGIRYAPGFAAGTDRDENRDHPYTATQVAEFLGWMEPSGRPREKVKYTLNALELIEAGILTEADYDGLGTSAARAVTEQANKPWPRPRGRPARPPAAAGVLPPACGGRAQPLRRHAGPHSHADGGPKSLTLIDNWTRDIRSPPKIRNEWPHPQLPGRSRPARMRRPSARRWSARS